MSVTATRVEWIPQEDYERAVLTVSGPKDVLLQEEVGAGRSPSLELFDSSGNPLPDGMYTYELRAVSRKKADGAPPELRQSGYLAIRDGSFLLMDASEPAKTPERPPIKHVTSELTTIPDDLLVTGKLIVQGGGGYGACIGDGCTSSDYGIPLMLKSGYLQIRFDDIPSFGNPVHDWILQANDNLGPGEYFTLLDGEAATRPFTVEGYAPDASLYVRSNGNVGLGTATPATRLDVKANSAGQAVARFQNSSATGYSGAEYLNQGGTTISFLGVDNANSTTRLNSTNSYPLVILTNSVERMRVTSVGNVGIGTSSPADKFHLFENADANTLLTVENSNTGTSAAGALRAKSDIAVVNVIAHGSGRTLSRFGQTLGGRGEILHTGGNGLVIGTLEADDIVMGTNNTNRLQINGSTGAVTVSGNLTVNGTFSNPSSRELKEGFEPVDPRTVLDKFARLSIQEWSYKSDARKLRHVGPTVEDFQTAFGLGTEGQYIFPMDVQGVTMTAVQGLYQLVQEKDAKIAELAQEKDAQIAELQKELREIRQLLLEKVAKQ